MTGTARNVLPAVEASVVAEERCPLNPSMYKRECSHCQGTARGTSQNPNFSVVESLYHGSPVIEVLKNGAAIHAYDQHFRFGCRKARIILACLPALKRFGWPSSEKDRTEFEPQIFTESKLGITVEVFAVMNPYFVRGDELIEQYWLDLKELPSLEVHKGLGVMKCRAVWSVQDEIRAWLARRCR
jgi:hypothetical protein